MSSVFSYINVLSYYDLAIFTYCVFLHLSFVLCTQIWPLVEKLDAEILTQDVHPLLRKAVYSGLRRPNDL